MEEIIIWFYFMIQNERRNCKVTKSKSGTVTVGVTMMCDR